MLQLALFSRSSTLHACRGQTCFGQSTALLVWSANGPLHATSGSIDSYPTYISRKTTPNEHISTTRRRTFIWYYLRTPTLRAASSTRTAPPAQFYALWDLIHLFPWIGYAKSNQQPAIAHRKRKLLLLKQQHGLLEYQP